MKMYKILSLWMAIALLTSCSSSKMATSDNYGNSSSTSYSADNSNGSQNVTENGTKATVNGNNTPGDPARFEKYKNK